MSRSVRRTARAMLGLVAAAAMLRTGPATAQTTGHVSSIKGSASASGVTAQYNPVGLLPIAAPLDLGAPDALATISNGPETFARASAADPGDLLANPDALLQAGGVKPGTLPPYPYRVQASSGVGAPSAESSPAPGLDARVYADRAGSHAQATMPAVTGPAALTVGSTSSTSSTASDGSTVTVHAYSEVHDVNVLGIMKIGSVVTDLTATSDGTAVQLSGATTVSNASVGGQAVTIDANGVHPSSGSSGVPNPVVAALNDLLVKAGIRITLAAPFEQQGGSTGQLSSGGLRIDLEISDRTAPILATIRSAFPPLDSPIPGAPGIEDVLALTKARQLAAVGLGRGAVVLSARSAASAVAPPLNAAPVASSVVTPSPGVAAAAPRAAPATPSLAAAAPAASEATDSSGGIKFHEGVGVVLFLALLVQPLIGDRLMRASTGLLAEDGVTACPREGR